MASRLSLDEFDMDSGWEAGEPHSLPRQKISLGSQSGDGSLPNDRSEAGRDSRMPLCYGTCQIGGSVSAAGHGQGISTDHPFEASNTTFLEDSGPVSYTHLTLPTSDLV